MKKMLIGTTLLASVFAFTGCGTDAKMASQNLSKSAEMFEIERRIVFVNTWTDKYLLSIEGKCSIENLRTRVAVTCKVGNNEFKKHYMGLGGNVTYVSEHLNPTKASTYHYRVIFKPQSILPDVDFRGSLTDIPKTDNKD